MEPSQDLEPAGELNASESGWTTYIGSPIYNEIYNDDEQSLYKEEYGNNYKNAHGNVNDEGDEGENKDDSNKDTDDEDTDDSMVSDASSGPSHLHLLNTNSGERSHGLDHTGHSGHDHEKIFSAKRSGKLVRKTRYERMVEKKEQEEEKEEYSLLVTDSTAASHVLGGAR